MESDIEFEEAAEYYCKKRELTLKKNRLGFGQDGIVFQTSRPSALKAFYRDRNYEVERDCYERLREMSIDNIAGFDLPSMLDRDDYFLLLEITIVSPPYLIDFGKAHLDRKPDYSDEVMDDYYREREKLFEPDQWPIVLEAVSDLESIGIYYLDLRPSNVRFRES